MDKARWPLLVIAAPAAVAVWSGWVGLGAMCGFGLVQPLPGIVAWHLDTAITLPVGVEAYGAYALGVWLAAGTPDDARRFAKRSAIGALVLGMFGQVIFHLLAAAGAHAAPWPVVVLVSCLPVAVVGCAAALTHLLLRAPGKQMIEEHHREAHGIRTSEPVLVPDNETSDVPVVETVLMPEMYPDTTDLLYNIQEVVSDHREKVPAEDRGMHVEPPAKNTGFNTREVHGMHLNGDSADVHHVLAELGTDKVPTIRAIRGVLSCGQPRATEIQAKIRSFLSATTLVG